LTAFSSRIAAERHTRSRVVLDLGRSLIAAHAHEFSAGCISCRYRRPQENDADARKTSRYKQDLEHETWELRFLVGVHEIRRVTVINSDVVRSAVFVELRRLSAELRTTLTQGRTRSSSQRLTSRCR
jgi:hypothetical protein